MNDIYSKHSVLITGVCGTVGRELLRQTVERTQERIVGIDNNESEIFFLSEQYREFPNVDFFVGDVRDRSKLTHKMRGIDIVLHSAALKHVGICERSPEDAIQTNILGVQNVIEAGMSNQVGRVLFTSSDKAVNPTNVMGTSKLMGERLITAANAQRRSKNDPVFATTRFGNVLGSRGSVIPLFVRQITSGGPVTLTDPEMTRFIMNLEDAVTLVLESGELAHGGEVFITKMPVVRIIDLAEAMVAELALQLGKDPSEIEIRTVGQRPGEKLYEELMSEEEARRTVELERFLVVRPAFTDIYGESNVSYPKERPADEKRPYNSQLESVMSVAQIRQYLRDHDLLRSGESA